MQDRIVMHAKVVAKPGANHVHRRPQEGGKRLEDGDGSGSFMGFP